VIKRLVWLVTIFLLLSPSPLAFAAEPDSGTIEGQIINGTEGGSSVANLEVTLQTYQNGAEVEATTAITDAEGRFVFAGLSTEPGYSYQVTLTFQQADYNSDWLTFDDGETNKSIEVTVYDATTSDGSIRVMTAHTVMYPELDSLRVEEYLLVVNESDRTYIGAREIAEGVRETLWFSLPDEATELQPGYGLMECCIYGSEDGFVDTMPVLPGGRELAYSYRINYNSGEYTFLRKVNYPTINYDLLVQGENVELASDQLAPTRHSLSRIPGLTVLPAPTLPRVTF
jgi:5-hydroxyisourate hydrolase-like protein (transthyretin family)